MPSYIYLNAKFANTQCHKVAHYTYHRPTYHLLAAKKEKTKNKGHTKNPAYLQKKKFKDISGGQKQKKEDRMSNKTGQNNKTADRQMESNDSPEIPRQGGDIRSVRPPFGPSQRNMS